MYELRKSLCFESAHRLPHMPEGHKCRRLHGHSFRATLILRGETQPNGLVIDYGDISEAASPVIKMLDHQFLNEVPGLENPTSEVLAKWIFERLQMSLPGLYQVIVSETCTTECRYPIR